MQDLRLVLIILGLIAIIALIAHGFWSNKKNQVKPLKDKPLGKVANTEKDSQGFDIDGIGAKRVVSKQLLTTEDAMTLTTPEPVNSEKIEPLFSRSFDQTEFSSVEPPERELSAMLMASPSATEISPDAEEDDPLIVQAEIVIDDISDPVTDDIQSGSSEVRGSKTTDSGSDEAVFVINIMARDGNVIAGAALLQELSSLGFKFGEMNIFHRHVDAAGKGPVIFSLANMVKPGTFDIDYMEQFQTPGVSLFMMYPCAGQASKNYNLMLNAAERIANGIDALLLDVSRNPLTPQAIQHDRSIILEFERKRDVLANKSH